MAGEIKPNPENGPLHFGPTSQFYETTVRAPAKGWPNPMSTAASAKEPLDDLRSEFAFFTPDANGRLALSRISVTSSAVPDAKGTTLTYQIENGGDSPVRVLFNPPATSQMVTEAAFIRQSSTIMPREKLTVSSFTQEELQSTTATIVFFNTQNDQIGMEAAGVYAPASARPYYPDDKFWPLPRK